MAYKLACLLTACLQFLENRTFSHHAVMADSGTVAILTVTEIMMIIIIKLLVSAANKPKTAEV